MLNYFIKKGPLAGAFFLCSILLSNCSSITKGNSNNFNKSQKANVEIFTVRDFFTQGIHQLYIDVFNKNEDVTIGGMTLYIFDKNCDEVNDDDTSKNTIKSKPVFIGPYKNGVITFHPGKRLKCYLVKNFHKY